MAWCVGQGQLVTSNDVIRKAADRQNQALSNALAAILPKGVSAKGLTDYLSDYDGRIVDGRCIRKFYDSHSKVSKFRLEVLDNSDQQAEIPF